METELFLKLLSKSKSSKKFKVFFFLRKMLQESSPSLLTLLTKGLAQISSHPEWMLFSRLNPNLSSSTDEAQRGQGLPKVTQPQSCLPA